MKKLFILCASVAALAMLPLVGDIDANALLRSVGNGAAINPNSATLTGGTINGMVIGGSTPAAGTFTTLSSNGLSDGATANALTLSGAAARHVTIANSASNPTISASAGLLAIGSQLIVTTGATANEVRTAQTTAPTCTSNCGTGTITVTGTDTAGFVTMGTTGSPASAWVLTFNGTWSAAPACIVQSALATMAAGKMPIAVVTTQTTMTVTTNGTAPANSDVYQYHCIGVS